MPCFERELPIYAEPVSAGKLEIGQIYFSVQYLDQGLLLPTVETLILTGTRLQEGETVFCFQDLGSYRSGVRQGQPDASEGIFYFQSERCLNHIFEYEYALDELIRCALIRRTAE